MWIVLSNETLQSSKGSRQHVCYCCRIEEFLMSMRHLSQELHFTTVGNLALLSCNKENARPEMLHLWEGVERECQDIDGHTAKVACRIYGQLQEWSLWGITASIVVQKSWTFLVCWQCLSTTDCLLYVDWAAIFCEIVTEMENYYSFEMHLLFLGGKDCVKVCLVR